MSNGYTSFMNIIAWLVLGAGLVLSFMIYEEYGTYIDIDSYFGLPENNPMAILDIIKVNMTSLTSFAVIQGLRLNLQK